MLTLVLALSLAAAPAAPFQAAPDRHHLAELALHDARSVRAALDAGVALDCQARRPGGLAEIVVTDAQLALLRQRGAQVTLLQTDLERYFERRLEDRPPRSPSPGIDWDGGSMGGYFTFAECVAVLDQLAAVNPAICSAKFSLGQSVEGREIWAVKVSDNVAVDEAEPEARFDSLHHAREPVSLHMALYFLDWLVRGYGVDPLATHLVNEREIWIVPCVNPDGYEHNRATNPNGGGLWRKNRRDNGNGTFGVDLNRNYSYQWGYDNSGSSGNTASETYRGPSPASEPETQAMEAFISGREFRTAISAHTYSDLWLFPWGYDCFDPPNRFEFDGIAEWYTAENGYVHGTICQELYSANGDSVDYDFGVHAIWSGTCEIGGSGDNFWPPVSRIVPLLEENLQPWARVALCAGAGIDSGAWQWVESSGDGDPWREPGEELDLVLQLANAGTLATSGAVTLALASSHADVVVVDGFHDFGAIAAFGSANNAAAPVRIRVDPAAQAGRRVTVTASLAYDGYVDARTFDVLVGQPVLFEADALEIDLGWIAGDPADDATTGAFEIADPQQTTSGGQTSQPADDHSPSGTLCAVTDGRAGSGAGTYDVDSGRTTVTSPEFDLSDVASPQVAYWRWFTDLTQDNDELVAQLSNDGGQTWVDVERVTSHANAWQQVVFDPAALLPLTDRMRLRWQVADDPNDSLCEALIDDLEFQGFPSGRAELWRYGTPVIGGTVRVAVQGPANLPFVLYGAQLPGSLLLKKLGLLELDPATLLALLADTTGPTGRWETLADLPADPALIGVEIHLQPLVLDPAGAYLANALDFEIE